MMVETDSLNRFQGPVSEPTEVYSAEDLPQVAPTNVGARPFNSTAINVTWSTIPNIRDKVRGKLIGYRIKYWNQVQKDEKTSTGCRKGAGTLFLYLRATGETKKSNTVIRCALYVLNSGLPDLSCFDIPKQPQNIPKGHKIYQRAIKYTKGP
jgi:hypothetical protein